MAGYQKLTLVGNVGADPTVTDTQQWGPVTNFDIAVNGRNNPPIWYSVSAWGKLGEAMAQYLSKGREVLVESDRFEPVWWTDRRTGDVMTRINVTASRVVFLDGGTPPAATEPATAAYRPSSAAAHDPHNGHRQHTSPHNGHRQPQQQREQQRDLLQPQWDNLANEQVANEIPF